MDKITFKVEETGDVIIVKKLPNIHEFRELLIRTLNERYKDKLVEYDFGEDILIFQSMLNHNQFYTLHPIKTPPCSAHDKDDGVNYEKDK